MKTTLQTVARKWRSVWPGGFVMVGLLAVVGFSSGTRAEKPVEQDRSAVPTHLEGQSDAAVRGYRFLVGTPVLPPDFHRDTFDRLGASWPEPLRSAAAQADPVTKRLMTLSRYGLTRRPERIESGEPTADEPPLQYVVTDGGQFVMNCLSCHGGTVLGQPYPGAPNTQYALQTLSEEVREAKFETGERLERMDLASLAFPLGGSDGTTNAVMFGVALMHYRDADLKVRDARLPPRLVHHDMDAPPWWHFHKKTHLYADAFAPKSPRALMQFMLVRENGPAFFSKHESDFEDVYAYLQSLRPPAYPFPVDSSLAERGRTVFANRCADCHGTYDQDPARANYPGRIVPWEEIGTDPVRLSALTPEQRRTYGASWFGHHGTDDVVADPGGYVAPPLDGVWASAPYFHNGSVPTLWHLLHPAERPTIWRRIRPSPEEEFLAGSRPAVPKPVVTPQQAQAVGYDTDRVGLWVEAVEASDSTADAATRRRLEFDTTKRGKSAAGHTFVDEMTEDEKRAVLEYLKTL